MKSVAFPFADDVEPVLLDLVGRTVALEALDVEAVRGVTISTSMTACPLSLPSQQRLPFFLSSLRSSSLETNAKKEEWGGGGECEERRL